VKSLLAVISLFFFGAAVFGQTDTLSKADTSGNDRFYLLQKINREGELLPEIQIKEVYIIPGSQPGETRRSQSLFRKYQRTVYNVRRVYPYALIVRAKLGDVNEKLASIPDDRSRRQYLKDIEKEVFGEYEDDMRTLTITQGKILIKLIDRETQNTSYDLIKEYRGGVSAVFWQSIARIFGTNLKEEYDPWGNDILIELIIREIESGGFETDE